MRYFAVRGTWHNKWVHKKWDLQIDLFYIWHSYVGQTSQNLKQSYQEHDSYITVSMRWIYFKRCTWSHLLAVCCYLRKWTGPPLWSPLHSFTLSCIPLIISFSPTCVWENAAHCTHLPIALDLHWSAVCPTFRIVLLCWLLFCVSILCVLCSFTYFKCLFMFIYILFCFLTLICSISRCNTLIQLFYKECLMFSLLDSSTPC